MERNNDRGKFPTAIIAIVAAVIGIFIFYPHLANTKLGKIPEFFN
jgi:hypothetical protein